jgi:hypothetical protein
MSRSEHATRREPGDPGDLERKRHVKALVARERLQPRPPWPEVVADAVPITVEDHEGPFVHHPASVDDLRAVIARLPPGSMDGIAGIELCLGRLPADSADLEDDAIDPLVGRFGPKA